MSTLGVSLTKADVAYLRLRRAIVTGEVTASESLDEAQIMRDFELGRTPCREALKRLALEHFVAWPTRRSPYVRAVDALEQARLHEARITLEVRTAELAAVRITADQLERLDQRVTEMRTHLVAGRIYEGVLCDHQIHHAIALAADNRFLAEAVAALNMGTLRLWYAALSRQDVSHVADDHQSLVDALRQGDAGVARAEMLAHTHQGYDRQLQLLDVASMSDSGGTTPTGR